MKKEVIDEKELERVEKTFRSFKVVMLLIDIFAIALLIIQIKMKDIPYYSYILLIICNLIVFLIKPKLIISKKENK